MAGRRDDGMIAEIRSFCIAVHPYGEIGIDIVQPGGKGLRIGGVAEHPGSHYGATGGIVAAIAAVGVG